MEKLKECDCPYKKSCHGFRQDLQVEIRDRSKASVEECMFYKILKPMYKEGSI